MQIRLSIREEPFRRPPGVEDYPCFESWRDDGGHEYGFSFRKGRELWIRLHGLGAFVFEPGRWEAAGLPDSGVGLSRLEETFFHFVAPLMLQRGSWDCLHASAVLTGSRVVAFCGSSGRGKSTLARAWTERGLVPYADDALPFLIEDGQAMSARLPHRPRLRGPAASRFRGAPQGNGNGLAGDQVVCDFRDTLRPLAAIYWLEPMLDAAERPVPRIEPVPAAESFRLLLSQAHCLSLEDRACNRKMVRNYLSLAQVAPVFRLSFAASLDLLPRVLDRLEQHQQEWFGSAAAGALPAVDAPR